MEYYIITFPSVSSAMKAEKLFRDTNVNAKTIPVPPEISDGCGFAIRFDTLDELNANKNVKDAKSIFYVQRENGKRAVQKLPM